MKKTYDDDDGRTIVDISGLERRPLIIPGPLGARGRIRRENKEEGEKVTYSREERRAAMSGALAAGLMIAGAIIAGLALIIILFTSFGK